VQSGLLCFCAALAALAVENVGWAGDSDPLSISVYCTAGDVQRYLSKAESREEVMRRLSPLQVTAVFLEGRRGDQYVSLEQLREVRDVCLVRGIQCRGGIATVPGGNFGRRQNTPLDWMNWESLKTRSDVAGFFGENARVFDEIIVDDFYCTSDTTAESERAKGVKHWREYRRDLLVSSIEPLMVKPARATNPRTRLIIKFPQWYDRFQMFGYDPARMPAKFDQVWVGTEVRDPNTKRMGFVQPTEGYMNFRWLSSVAGKKAHGAWFDHIECSAQNFVDQAYESVLAGARELTLFSLNDLMEGHPGDVLLASQMAELKGLAEKIQKQKHRGIAYYKPANSDGEENLYLADYLGMIGLPILPQSQYPEHATVAFLPVQAAADEKLASKMKKHLERGATLVMTPALARRLDKQTRKLAGIEVSQKSEPAFANAIRLSEPIGREGGKLDVTDEIDASVSAAGCEIVLSAVAGSREVPFLTRKRLKHGVVMVLNVRTFSETDFGGGEWLLAPKELGLPKIPESVANTIRAALLAALGVAVRAPAGVQLLLFDKESCFYSFHSQPIRVESQGRQLELPPHRVVWQ